jgi:hypothetical protein
MSSTQLEQLALAPRLTPFSNFVLEIRGASEFRDRLKNEISGIFVIDNKTISITLEKSFPAFEDYLTGPGGYIIPKPGVVARTPGVVGSTLSRHCKIDALCVGAVDPRKPFDSLKFIRQTLTIFALSFELGRLDMTNFLVNHPDLFQNHTAVNVSTNCSLFSALTIAEF